MGVSMRSKFRFLSMSTMIIFFLILVFSSFISDKLLAMGSSEEKVSVEILPRLELLSGVLSQTIWMEIRGPKEKGNIYFQELQKFFSNYKNHQAITIAKQLTQNGFTFDKPIIYILNLSEIPYLEATNGYSDNLIEIPKSEEILEDFRLALIDLEKKSNFKEDFFDKHQSDYNRYIKNVQQDLKGNELIEWMNNFYGYIHAGYHLVLAPAMFPSGGYGITIENSNGEKEAYQIFRESGISEKEPVFYKKALYYLSLHEWGHSFVNPAIERNREYINKYNLNQLLEPVKEIMRKQAYSNVETFLNEQILRGITTYALKQNGKDYLKYETNRGFYLTEFTVEQIEYYQANRDKFKTFDDFVPYLLEQYNENRGELLNNASSVNILSPKAPFYINYFYFSH